MLQSVHMSMKHTLKQNATLTKLQMKKHVPCPNFDDFLTQLEHIGSMKMMMDVMISVESDQSENIPASKWMLASSSMEWKKILTNTPTGNEKSPVPVMLRQKVSVKVLKLLIFYLCDPAPMVAQSNGAELMEFWKASKLLGFTQHESYIRGVLLHKQWEPTEFITVIKMAWDEQQELVGKMTACMDDQSHAEFLKFPDELQMVGVHEQ